MHSNYLLGVFNELSAVHKRVLRMNCTVDHFVIPIVRSTSEV